MNNNTANPAPSIPLINVKTAQHLGYLNYEIIELTNAQKRLTGRQALKPIIDLADYTTKAVIDWIDIHVLLNRKTQFQWLQGDIEKIIGRKVHVENSLGRAHANDPDEKFVIRFQEPDIKSLRAIFALIKEKYGLGLDPLIGGIEISVDFYPKTHGEYERARMVCVLANHILVKRDVITDHRDRPRAVWGQNKGDYQRLLAGNPNYSEGANRRLLIETEWDHATYSDATVTIGAREADVRWRIMDKTIDTQNRDAGTFKALAEKDKRARVEVTLTGDALSEICPMYFQELTELNFTRLQARYFGFVLPTVSGKVVHKTRWREAVIVARDRQRIAKFRKTGGIGLKAMDDAVAETQKIIRKQSLPDMHNRGLKLPAKKRIAMGASQTFVAYEELNERVLTALRSLGERVRKGFVK